MYLTIRFPLKKIKKRVYISLNDSEKQIIQNIHKKILREMQENIADKFADYYRYYLGKEFQLNRQIFRLYNRHTYRIIRATMKFTAHTFTSPF